MKNYQIYYRSHIQKRYFFDGSNVNIKSLSLRPAKSQSQAAKLIEQINSIPQIRLFPSQKKLTSKYKSFLSSNFPDVDVSAKLILEQNQKDTNNQELNLVLAKIYTKNESFAAYVDACLQTAEVGQVQKSIESRRREARFAKNLEKGELIQSDIIFELLCRHYASKNDWLAIEHTLGWLKEDGIPPSLIVCLAALECLGGLLQTSSQRENKRRKALVEETTEEHVLHSYLEIKILEVLSMAEGHDVNVYDGLLRYPRRQNSLYNILTALIYVNQEKTPNISFNAPLTSIFHNKKILEITKRVCTALDASPVSSDNIFSDVFANRDAMMDAFQAQLRLETAGRVYVNPVLPFFEEMLRQSSPHTSASKPSHYISSPTKQAAMRKLLHAEQNVWRKRLIPAFETTLQRLKIAHTHGQVSAYPFLKILPRKAYIDLLVEAISTIVTNTELQHVSRSLFLLKLGDRIEAACLTWRKQNAGIIDELSKVYESYAMMFTDPVRKDEQFREMWLRSLKINADKGISLDPEWPHWNSHIRLIVGQELYRILYDHLTFNLNVGRILPSDGSKKAATTRQEAPVLFEVMSDNPGDVRCEIRVHPSLLKWYRNTGNPPLTFDVTELPMLCPPIPWIDTKRAGYLLASSDATRFIRKANYFSGSDAAANDDLDFDAETIPTIFDSLNTLASCPWRVNTVVLDAMIKVARGGGDKELTIPEIKSLKPITPKKFDSSLTREERGKAYKKAMDIRKAHDETRSLWATEMYRISIANQYRDKVFWFPHSMDFRGRVYPCPPHFHHMGSDVARGLIVFAKGLPLGDNGLRWLKIHLANLTGKVKRSANFEREAYADTILDEVFDSVDKPFNGRGWWREQEEPWQTLACCRELAAALRHPGSPATYINHFPVHQDGSCNGLQHYAAMGRDERGAASVSLEDRERPRDVYTDVTEVVENQRAEDAAAGVPVAEALKGFVQRKVIKQSVMTTVYGVTMYGAMAQIRRQLRDIPDFPADRWLGPASSYLARLTLTSISAIFTSSSATQTWFGKLARYITRNRACRISWVTPLGLPIVQPYVKCDHDNDFDAQLWSGSANQKGPLDIKALTKAANLAERHHKWKGSKDSLVGLPLPNPIKQKNAFPPNFIHSLDSCHMMLTALHCFREGIQFASVHDCFWTHAASVDKMNRICREEFVALHTEPLLENLSDYLRSKFEYSKKELDELPLDKRIEAEQFNQLLIEFPKRGTFDLNEVLKSTYFFS